MRCAIAALLLCFVRVPANAEERKQETCEASRYSIHDRDQNGTTTSSGVPLNDAIPTVAHKSASLRAFLRITNLDNGLTMTFQTTDRGPYVAGRCVDLSMKADALIQCQGKCRVKVEPWIGW